MLNRSSYWLLGMLFFMTAGLITTSCNKKFDAPPSFVEPSIQANTTIKQLKAMHTMGNIERITDEIIVGGVVVADDKSGNFYKSIAIQDATGGITVRLDGSNLFNSYPVGRKVFIRMKGLYLGDYNKLYQIGGGIDDTDPSRPELAPLASSLFDTYIVKGSTGNAVTPKVVTVDQLHDSLQSMLIQLNSMEFIPADTSKTYADASGKVTRNLYVKACSGNNLILRTSGYSTIAGVNVPNGNGTLLSVYTVFGTTKQLVIRDTSDVRFTGPRCGTGPTTEMNIADLRALYTGTAPVTIPDARRIKGIVISDRAAKNINDRNVIIQQGNNLGGIMVRFEAAHSFDLGDMVEVNVSSQSLEEFNGTLQVNNVPLAYASKVGTGTVTPRVTTLANALANFEAWESTLIKVDENVTLSGTGTTWSTLTTFTAGAASIKTFVFNAADFAGATYPTTAASVVGYLNQGGNNKDQQLLIRTASDVTTATTPPPPPPPATNIVLSASPFILNFNDIGTALPAGVTVRTGASATTLGTTATLTTSPTDWNNTSGAFKNFASGNITTDGTATSAEQSGSSDRALGIRQTGSVGDPGAAFVFEINNTTGKTNLKMEFKLQSLDKSTTGRTVVWKVQYGIGDAPASFTDATVTGTMTTVLGTFANNTVTVDFGAALNNLSEKVWVRIIAPTASTGSGSRPSTAIDDVKFTWN